MAIRPGRGDRRRRHPLTAASLIITLAALFSTASAGAAAEPRDSAPGGVTPAIATPAGDAAEIRLRRVLDGFEWPVYVTSDGSAKRLFIVEQPGRILVARWRNGAWTETRVFLDIRHLVVDPRQSLMEQGLLGLAFHPDYPSNGLFYVWYSRDHVDPERKADIVLAEFQRSTARRADPASRRTLFVIHATYGYHNGGWMAFGPDDLLYIAVGDGGGRGDPDRKAQDKESRQGKLLRLDPLDPDGDGPARFSAPPDNPFAGDAFGDDLVWAWGLRNPWRGSFDRATGDLWLSDVGSFRQEEINRLVAPDPARAANFGWPRCEGTLRYTGAPGPPPCDRPATVRPVITLSHDVADPVCAVIGGYVYRGALQPSLVGRYVFADFCSRRIWKVPADFDDPDHTALPTARTIRHTPMSFGEDANGELYLTTLEGGVFRVVERPPRP